MSPTTTAHVGVTVGALDAALEFYVEVFGCRLLRRFTPGGHADIRALVDLPDADLDAAFVSLPDGRVLELLHYRRPTPGPAACSPAAPGALHLAVPVDDVRGTVKRLVARGGTIIGEVVELDGRALAYARDPDGTLLEIVEADEGGVR